MNIAFDVNGTLTDPGGLGEPWARSDLGQAMLEGAVRTAMLDAVAGAFRPFDEHVRASVQWHARNQGLDLALVDAAMQRAAHLDPWPDAAAALDLLIAAGHKPVAFTNSGAEAGQKTLEAAGLQGRFAHILGVDTVARSKPHPATYAYLTHELGTSAKDTWLVAAHDWDIDGAGRAGLQTVWISRDHEDLNAAIREPTDRASSLLAAAQAVITGARATQR